MYVPEDAVSGYMTSRQVGESRSGLRIAKERGVAYIVAVQEKGPAAVLGLEQGDIVSRLNGQSTRELPLWQIEKALTGAAGSKIELEVLRAGETRNFTLELAEFEPPVAYLENYQNVPRLRIASFSKDAAAVVTELLSTVQGSELLVDVRGTAFGDVERAYEVAKLFAAGDFGFLMKRDEKLETYTGAGAQSWRGKTVVLVDRGTQGAAELVGQPTFGFAGRSKVIDLDSGGSIVLTDAFFTGPDGKPVDEGLEPDVLVGDRARSFKEIGESINDLILERALDVLHEQPAAAEKKAA
jgi:carboxyl-terminal processing protease